MHCVRFPPICPVGKASIVAMFKKTLLHQMVAVLHQTRNGCSLFLFLVRLYGLMSFQELYLSLALIQFRLQGILVNFGLLALSDNCFRVFVLVLPSLRTAHEQTEESSQ